jgi:hypothetical protein
VQVLKSAQDFELFGGTALALSGRALENSKAKAILGRCAIVNPATAVSRFTPLPALLNKHHAQGTQDVTSKPKVSVHQEQRARASPTPNTCIFTTFAALFVDRVIKHREDEQ